MQHQLALLSRFSKLRVAAWRIKSLSKRFPENWRNYTLRAEDPLQDLVGSLLNTCGGAVDHRYVGAANNSRIP